VQVDGRGFGEFNTLAKFSNLGEFNPLAKFSNPHFTPSAPGVD